MAKLVMMEKETQKQIGKLSFSKKRKTGMGGGTTENINKYDLVATGKIYNPEDNKQVNLVTWYWGEGKIKKQLDFITISDKNRNCVIRSKVNWVCTRRSTISA